MLDERTIIEKLEAAGFKGAQLQKVMRDVGEVISLRVLAAYVLRLSEEERAELRSLSEEDLRTYVEQHASSLPKFPQEEFEKIYDETWKEYFRSVA